MKRDLTEKILVLRLIMIGVGRLIMIAHNLKIYRINNTIFLQFVKINLKTNPLEIRRHKIQIIQYKKKDIKKIKIHHTVFLRDFKK